MGVVEGLLVRPKRHGEISLRESILGTVEKGLQGDYYQKKGPRQVSVLFADQWEEAIADFEEKPHWWYRRANILVRGIRNPQTVGVKLRLGSLILEITGECDPCMRMEEVRLGLEQKLLNWRGGVTAQVDQQGHVHIGDAVEILP